MRRIALITAIIAVLLLIDGTYLQLSNNEVGGDSGVLFGNPHLFLSAGTVVLISGGLLLLGAALMWAVLAYRKGRLPGRGDKASQPLPSQPLPSQATAEVATAQAQAGEGQRHQPQP
jgi:hypothetical protein